MHQLRRYDTTPTVGACTVSQIEAIECYQVKVTALLTDVTTGTFLESVASFIDRVRQPCVLGALVTTLIVVHSSPPQASAKEPEPRKDWVKPVLEPSRVVAVTDSYGNRHSHSTN